MTKIWLHGDEQFVDEVPQRSVYMDEQTVREQSTWEHYKAIEAENYHLKKQLLNKNKEIKRLKHIIRLWKGKFEKLTENKKPRYRNNGKSGK